MLGCRVCEKLWSTEPIVRWPFSRTPGITWILYTLTLLMMMFWVLSCEYHEQRFCIKSSYSYLGIPHSPVYSYFSKRLLVTLLERGMTEEIAALYPYRSVVGFHPLTEQ